MKRAAGRCKIFVVSLLGLGFLTGCNHNDTEGLARIGRKLAAKAKARADDMGSKLDLPRIGVRRDPSLQEKVQDRLRWEKSLADIAFEVNVKDKEVELKGAVNNHLQRQRAIDLAESVVGVEKVNGLIQVREGEVQVQDGIPTTIVP
jgi:osmotically-inducible protein OsmY